MPAAIRLHNASLSIYESISLSTLPAVQRTVSYYLSVALYSCFLFIFHTVFTSFYPPLCLLSAFTASIVNNLSVTHSSNVTISAASPVVLPSPTLTDCIGIAEEKSVLHMCEWRVHVFAHIKQLSSEKQRAEQQLRQLSAPWISWTILPSAGNYYGSVITVW